MDCTVSKAVGQVGMKRPSDALSYNTVEFTPPKPCPKPAMEEILSAMPPTLRTLCAWDPRTRVLRVKMSIVREQGGRHTLLELFERSDIALIVQNASDGLNKRLWSLKYVLSRMAPVMWHKFRVFKQCAGNNTVGTQAVAGGGGDGGSAEYRATGWRSMRVRDYQRYLIRRTVALATAHRSSASNSGNDSSSGGSPDTGTDTSTGSSSGVVNGSGSGSAESENAGAATAADTMITVSDHCGQTHTFNVLHEVIYMLDVPVTSFLPELLADLHAAFGLSGCLPGGDACWLRFVPPAGRPPLGPNLYIAPPGATTWFHEDGRGTVDSGHLCLSGENEVVLLPRGPDARKDSAMRRLRGGEADDVSTACADKRCSIDTVRANKRACTSLGHGCDSGVGFGVRDTFFQSYNAATTSTSYARKLSHAPTSSMKAQATRAQLSVACTTVNNSTTSPRVCHRTSTCTTKSHYGTTLPHDEDDEPASSSSSTPASSLHQAASSAHPSSQNVPASPPATSASARVCGAHTPPWAQHIAAARRSCGMEPLPLLVGGNAEAFAQVLEVGEVVDVARREWIGMNREGGTARVIAIHRDTDGATGQGSGSDVHVSTAKVISCDVKYIIDSRRERNVPLRFIRLQGQRLGNELQRVRSCKLQPQRQHDSSAKVPFDGHEHSQVDITVQGTGVEVGSAAVDAAPTGTMQALHRRWPSDAALRRVQEVDGMQPLRLRLRPGEYVHLNKGRLHAFKKVGAGEGAVADADMELGACMSVAWDWLFQGVTQAGFDEEARVVAQASRRNRCYQLLSLAPFEAAVLHAALSTAAHLACSGPVQGTHVDHAFADGDHCAVFKGSSLGSYRLHALIQLLATVLEAEHNVPDGCYARWRQHGHHSHQGKISRAGRSVRGMQTVTNQTLLCDHAADGSSRQLPWMTSAEQLRYSCQKCSKRFASHRALAIHVARWCPRLSADDARNSEDSDYRSNIGGPTNQDALVPPPRLEDLCVPDEERRVDPLGCDGYNCQICHGELANGYMHCMSCERTFAVDFNLCFACHRKLEASRSKGKRPGSDVRNDGTCAHLVFHERYRFHAPSSLAELWHELCQHAETTVHARGLHGHVPMLPPTPQVCLAATTGHYTGVQ